VEAFKQSAALHPSAESYGHLGTAYFYLRRYDDAAESIKQALKIDSKDWLNRGNLGDTQYQNPAWRAEANC
jgi:tetratricopeptide (TPR) repeat protein